MPAGLTALEVQIVGKLSGMAAAECVVFEAVGMEAHGWDSVGALL